jgi:hypothetical protein
MINPVGSLPCLKSANAHGNKKDKQEKMGFGEFNGKKKLYFR